jgi:guanylate kinase
MSSKEASRGTLIVVSAPSGTGKTTVVERLVQSTPRLHISRSYTSRPARMGEADGVDYNFVSRSRFEAMIAGSQFLEWAEIYGNLYGTSIVDTERRLAAGDDLVLVIDVQGARQVRRHQVAQLSVFIMPPSARVLEDRLRGRGTDRPDQVKTRLQVARGEVRAFPEYDFVVVNDEVEACAERVRSIIVGSRARLESMREAAELIARSFDDGIESA